jgi:hypothetical protein
MTVAGINGDISTQGTLGVSGQTTLNGGLSINQGKMTVAGINGDISTKGIITCGSNPGIFMRSDIQPRSDNFYFWNRRNGQILLIGDISGDYKWGKEIGFDVSNCSIYCNNIYPGALGSTVGTELNLQSRVNINGDLYIGTSGNTKKIYLNGTELITSTSVFTLNVVTI